MTEIQKNKEAAALLNELALATLFLFALSLLFVVAGEWISVGFELTLFDWFWHFESFVIAVTVFHLVVRLQPKGAWIQKHYTNLKECFWRWC